MRFKKVGSESFHCVCQHTLPCVYVLVYCCRCLLAGRREAPTRDLLPPRERFVCVFELETPAPGGDGNKDRKKEGKGGRNRQTDEIMEDARGRRSEERRVEEGKRGNYS